jgi:hypothetical protein
MGNSTVYFIDAGVADYQALIAGLPDGSVYYLLDRKSDGLVQISNILNFAGYDNLDAIQILSHGSSGELYLGNTTLNNDSIGTYRNLLTSIGSHLSETGDLMLYGCDVAQGNEGQKFINTLASITGADVAASTNITGNSNLGGDWVLEAKAGNIESTTLNINTYTQVLPSVVGSVINGTVNDDTLVGTGLNDTITGFAGND